MTIHNFFAIKTTKKDKNHCQWEAYSVPIAQEVSILDVEHLFVTGSEFESVERATAKREHIATQWGGGAARPWSPRTSSVPSAEGRAPGGGPRGASPAGDVSLAELFDHLDSPEYLDTLHQLADTLFKEIDASAAGKDQNVSLHKSRYWYTLHKLNS